MYKIRETTVRILDQARVHIAPMRIEDDTRGDRIHVMPSMDGGIGKLKS